MKWLARAPFMSSLLVAVVLAFPGSLRLAPGFDDPVVVPPGTTINGNVATIIDSITVSGTVTGDVTSWSGSIRVDGTVTGDVVSYAGSVELGPQAQVRGSVLGLAGTAQSTGAAVAGQTFGQEQPGSGALASVVDLIVPGTSGGAGGLTSAGRVLVGFIIGMFVLAFGTLWRLLWPHRTIAAARVLHSFPLRSLFLGVCVLLVLALVLPPVLMLLLASVIGVPIALLLLIAAHVPWVYGLATLSETIASQSGAALWGRIAVIGAIALVVAVALALQPLIGLALFYTLLTPGVGAVLLSRGGTAQPAQYVR